MVLGFAKYSKRSNETPVSYTLKIHHRVFISRSIENGGAFKMVVVPTGCAIAVDHPFNFRSAMGQLLPQKQKKTYLKKIRGGPVKIEGRQWSPLPAFFMDRWVTTPPFPSGALYMLCASCQTVDNCLLSIP